MGIAFIRAIFGSVGSLYQVRFAECSMPFPKDLMKLWARSARSSSLVVLISQSFRCLKKGVCVYNKLQLDLEDESNKLQLDLRDEIK